jgi:CRISPR-associated endonuclease Csn1
MNKTLCHAGANKLKGNRTPYEAFGGTPKWDGILMRIERFQCPKRERFTMKEIPDDFISRQLNDTAYISREAKNLLEGMDYKVSVSMGRATAQLRRLWGLHNVLGGAAPRVDGSGGGGVKNREDHRHHAIDAVVVAFTDAQTLHKLSLCYEQGKTPTGWSFPAPWDNFRSDVERLAGRILVSHRVNKRVRGQLHEEQYYGYTGRVNDKKTPLYAVRKKLEDLTPAMLKRIRDREVQKIIIDALTSSNVPLDDKKSIKNYFKDKENHTVFMKCGKGLNIPINKVRIDVPAGNMIQLPGRNKTFVEPGNNHHAVFYRYTDKNGKPRYDAEVCTLFEAVKRLKKGEAVIRRRLAEGKEFLFSLSINELLLFIGDGSDGKPIPIDLKNREQTSRILYRVQKISDAIVFRRHDHALIDDKNKDMFKRVAIKKVSNDAAAGKILKVRIDRLGRLDRAND